MTRLQSQPTRSLPPKRLSTPRSARRLSTTNRGLLPGTPASTRTGLTPAGLIQLSRRTMALRAYGSHRLTIYDADLSTRAVTAPAQIRQLLTYTSPDIEIRPAPLVPTSDKTLGWCAHRLYKHLADLAFIAERLHDRLDPQLLRDLTDGKLDTMRKLQPAIYEDLRSLADVIATLERPGPITPRQQQGVRFLRNPCTPEQVIRIVRERYVPLLKP
jgi:hypothetical protein